MSEYNFKKIENWKKQTMLKWLNVWKDELLQNNAHADDTDLQM
jgi:hypothetical protein